MNLVSFVRHFIGCPDFYCAIFTQSADPILLPFTVCHFTGIARVMVYHHHHLHRRLAGKDRLQPLPVFHAVFQLA